MNSKVPIINSYFCGMLNMPIDSLKPYLGGIALCLGFVAYAIYISGILSNKTKPHAFSWLLWTLTTATVYLAQVSKGGGAGSWSTGFTCIVCLGIGIISLFKYDKAYTLSDGLFIGFALLALVPWFFTKDPTLSVFIIASIDVIGYGPTLRKSFYYPHEEASASFGLNSAKHLFALLALQHYMVATWIYPASQIFMNGLVVVLIAVRKRQLNKKAEKIN